ncbi:hypothetical protein AAVH_13104 [Aphelenchoides avenae]|nr:hypothetical protein AAVH_13104 [Aphelenchus avenae]
MPPKGDPKRTVETGKDGNGPTFDNVGNGSDGFGPVLHLDGGNGIVPPASSVAAAPVQQRTLSASSASSAPMEVDLTKESIKDKVSSGAKAFEKLFYAYGDHLTQTTQEVLAKAKGVDAQSAKEISGSWSTVRKQMQPKLNQCLLNLVESVHDEVELEAVKETAHLGVRPVAFRDLVENARADIVQSLEELVQWVITNALDPATLQSVAGLKQEAHTQVYDTVDFGRDSDYGQALQAQQNLARKKDDLQLQLEGFRKQVDDLKASEDDLYAQCTELQGKFSNAQAALLASKDKFDILGAVTKFLGTDDANVLIVADQQKHNSSGSGGTNGGAESKVTGHFKVPRSPSSRRARKIGFVVDPSGNLQLGPSPRQVFDISKPYSYTSRNQSIPAPPPLKVFLGDFKEDQMDPSEFLKMYKHRYGPCGEDTKVDMLGDYLAGEAKRAYRSILSSWDGSSRITFDELESRMKNLMLDNSRTGMLLKQQRVHGLRMKEDES